MSKDNLTNEIESTAVCTSPEQIYEYIKNPIMVEKFVQAVRISLKDKFSFNYLLSQELNNKLSQEFKKETNSSKELIGSIDLSKLKIGNKIGEENEKVVDQNVLKEFVEKYGKATDKSPIQILKEMLPEKKYEELIQVDDIKFKEGELDNYFSLQKALKERDISFEDFSIKYNYLEKLDKEVYKNLLIMHAYEQKSKTEIYNLCTLFDATIDIGMFDKEDYDLLIQLAEDNKLRSVSNHLITNILDKQDLIALIENGKLSDGTQTIIRDRLDKQDLVALIENGKLSDWVQSSIIKEGMFDKHEIITLIENGKLGLWPQIHVVEKNILNKQDLVALIEGGKLYSHAQLNAVEKGLLDAQDLIALMKDDKLSSYFVQETSSYYSLGKQYFIELLQYKKLSNYLKRNIIKKGILDKQDLIALMKDDKLEIKKIAIEEGLLSEKDIEEN